MSTTEPESFDQEAEGKVQAPFEPSSAARGADPLQPDQALPATYQEDVRLVESLLNPMAADHVEAWGMVSRLVRSIIRKHLFRPIDDRSIEEEDLLQIVLTEIAISLHRFNHRCRLTTWLHQIAINSLRRGYRDRNAQRRRGGTVTLCESVADTRNSVAEEANWQNLIEEITTFLSGQPDPRLSTIFYLSLIEERRLVEIGKHLNLSTARVHALLKVVYELLQNNSSLQEHARLEGLGTGDEPQ